MLRNTGINLSGVLSKKEIQKYLIQALPFEDRIQILYELKKHMGKSQYYRYKKILGV